MTRSKTKDANRDSRDLSPEEEAELRTLLAGFRHGESYVLTRAIDNPACDKRKRWGSDLASQDAVILKGARFVCAAIARDHGVAGVEVYLRQVTKGDLSLGATLRPAQDYSYGGPPVSLPDHAWLHGHNRREIDVAFAILRALRHEERSIATIEGLRKNEHRACWRILERLQAIGKITVSDVDAALAAMDAEDEAAAETEEKS